jgi:hypothetical protein
MPGSLRCFGLQGATSFLTKMEDHVYMILTIMVCLHTVFKSYGSPLHPPSFIYAGIKIYMACHFFRLQVMSCHGEESEDEGMSTADELAKTVVAIGSPKIDVSMLRHVFTTK